MKSLGGVTIVAIGLLAGQSRTTAAENTWSLVTPAGDTLYNCPLDSLYGNSIEGGTPVEES